MFFFFNDTATTEIYTLSLHDALPISKGSTVAFNGLRVGEVTDISLLPEDPRRVVAVAQLDSNTPIRSDTRARLEYQGLTGVRSEEHTSELQSRQYLVCRLLLEKKYK